jgi:hypothetical protein
MHETELYQPIITAAAAVDVRLIRLRDDGGKQPFDLIGRWSDGRAVGLEVKIDRRPGSFRSSEPLPESFWRGRAHQVGWLTDYAKHGGIGLIALLHLATLQKFLLQTSADERGVRLTPAAEMLIGRAVNTSNSWLPVFQWASPSTERTV